MAGPLAELDANVPLEILAANAKSRLKPSKKRSHDDHENGNHSSEPNPDEIEIPDGTPIDMNCDQVRRRIRAYINSGATKVGEFQDKLGVSGRSYGSFMGQNGPHKGLGSDTYDAAWAFFKKMELASVKMPRKKKAKKSEEGGAANDKENGKTGKKGGSGDVQKDKEKVKEKDFDITAIHLPGEDTGTVPIYDTCDDVRRKINAHLRSSDMSQAAFRRAISKCLPSDIDDTGTCTPAPVLSAARLNTFLNHKGPRAGNDSPVFYAAYVWFEKLRVKEGKGKSKKRLEMEKVWARNVEGGSGMDRYAGRFVCRGPGPGVDQYGLVHFDV